MRKKRYGVGTIFVILVCLLYYAIDYRVVSGNVSEHVKQSLAAALQGVGQAAPSVLTDMAPRSFRSDLYNTFDNSYRVINPESYFVQQQVQDNTWLGLNTNSSSPICLVNIMQITLGPQNTSVVAFAHVRFVGPFGFQRSIDVSETQPVKQYPVK